MAARDLSRVAGYLRVSSARQRDESDSPASQRERLKQAGATRFFEDLGVSGYKLEERRKAAGFQQLMAAIEAGEIDRLLIVRLDRLARRDQLVMEVAEACEKHGVEFVSLGSGAVDVSSSAGWLSVRMQTTIAEHFSRQLSENIRNGYQGLHAQGIPARSAGSLPVHLMREPGTRHGVIPSPMWDDCRAVIEGFLSGGYRLSDAADFLAERHGRLSHGRSVRAWLQQPHLMGHLCKRDGTVVIRDCWPAICAPVEFEQIQAKLTENRLIRGRNIPARPEDGGPRPPREIRALSGLCTCYHCGQKLAYAVARRPSGHYSYLRCGNRQCPTGRAAIRADHLEQALLMQLLGDHLHRIALALAAADTDHHIPSSEALQRQQELRARQALPEQFRTDADRQRIQELQRLIAAERREPTAPDPRLMAVLHDQLRTIPVDSGWGTCFYGQIDGPPGSAWGWFDGRSESQRHQDLALLIENLTVDPAAGRHAPAQATAREKSSLWIKRVHWRIPVWGPGGPMVEGEDL